MGSEVIKLNASRGLGDAIYLRAAALHMLDRGEQVAVYTQWPTVFSDLPVDVRPLTEREGETDLRHVANSLNGHDPQGRSNFAACCANAGIAEPVELRAKWTVRNHALLERIQQLAAGRPIFVYQPRKRAQNAEQKLIRPETAPYNAFIGQHSEYFRVRLGQTPFVEFDRSAACEIDLLDKTSISDAFDIGTIGNFFFGESCFIPMLGEANSRRYAVMFTRRALNSEGRMRFMTPERLFHKRQLGEAVYDES